MFKRLANLPMNTCCELIFLFGPTAIALLANAHPDFPFLAGVDKRGALGLLGTLQIGLAEHVAVECKRTTKYGCMAELAARGWFEGAQAWQFVPRYARSARAEEAGRDGG